MSGALRDYVRFVALAAGAALVLAAAGWVPTRRMAGTEGLTALMVACGLCWIGSALGGVPVLLAAGETEGDGTGDGTGSTPRQPLTVLFGSSLVRLAAVVGLALAAALSGLVSPVPLLLWTAIGYLGLLTVDTWYAVSATGAARQRGAGSMDRSSKPKKNAEKKNAEQDGPIR